MLHTRRTLNLSKGCNFKVYKYTFERTVPPSPTRFRGWSGGAMVLGKLPVPGRPTIWITVGQGPTVLAVGAGGGCLDIFTLVYPFFPLSPSLWETARYRLKYCLKGPLNPKTTNQPTTRPVFNGGLFLNEKILFSSLKAVLYFKMFLCFGRANRKSQKLFPL